MALAVGLGVAVALGPVLGMEMVSRFLVDAMELEATNMETGSYGSVWTLWDPADFFERRRQKAPSSK